MCLMAVGSIYTMSTQPIIKCFPTLYLLSGDLNLLRWECIRYVSGPLGDCGTFATHMDKCSGSGVPTYMDNGHMDTHMTVQLTSKQTHLSKFSL